MRSYLRSDQANGCALFWDYTSVPQKSAISERTAQELEQFKRGLEVMGNFYASVTRTSVMQVKHVPPRPAQYDGRVLFFNLPADTQEDELRTALSEFGTVVDCNVLQGEGACSAGIRFATHAEAERAVAEMKSNPIGSRQSWSTLEYNDRPYDGDERAEGRGWPAFEQGASLTVAAHLASAERKGQLPTPFRLAQRSRPKLVEIREGGVYHRDAGALDATQLLADLEHTVGRAVFTGKGDKEVVMAQLKKFKDLIEDGLTSWMREEEANVTEEDYGGAVFEMAGACWVLPEFAKKLGKTPLVSTLKERLMLQLSGPSDSDGGIRTVFRDLWGAGGALSTLFTKTARRSDELVLSKRGLTNRWYESVAASAVIAFLPQHGFETAYVPPPPLKECFDALLKAGARLDDIKKRSLFADSFVLECGPDVWGGEASRGLAQLIGTLRELEQVAWLSGYQPLVARQHGDLNLGNVLVDSREWHRP